jgi:hypothetical protein
VTGDGGQPRPVTGRGAEDGGTTEGSAPGRRAASVARTKSVVMGGQCQCEVGSGGLGAPSRGGPAWGELGADSQRRQVGGVQRQHIRRRCVGVAIGGGSKF